MTKLTAAEVTAAVAERNKPTEFYDKCDTPYITITSGFFNKVETNIYYQSKITDEVTLAEMIAKRYASDAININYMVSFEYGMLIRVEKGAKCFIICVNSNRNGRTVDSIESVISKVENAIAELSAE